MNPRKDGGPAFPLENPRHLEDGELFRQFTGMSLRDYFAGQALVGLLSHSNSDGSDFLHEAGYDAAAYQAYRFADAMLRASRPLREPRETGEE